MLPYFYRGRNSDPEGDGKHLPFRLVLPPPIPPPLEKFSRNMQNSRVPQVNILMKLFHAVKFKRSLNVSKPEWAGTF